MTSSSVEGELLPQNVTNVYHSQQFEIVNEDLRRHLKLANNELENVKDKVNELVVIIHNDNKDWSIKKICNYIAGKNSDFEEFGFSARTIYNYLNEENRRQLVDLSKSHTGSRGSKPKHSPSQELEDFRQQKGTILQNNVMDQSSESLKYDVHQIVPEQSSSTSSITINGEVIGGGVGRVEDEEVIYDDPVKIIKQYEQKIIELCQPYDFIIKITYEGKDLYVIATAEPETKSGFGILDIKKTKKLKEF